jgi:hypothetical protein
MLFTFTLNKVSGKIIEKISSVGIPNLQVVLYDVDPNIPHQEVVGFLTAIPPNVDNTNFWQKLKGTRLGSTITDEDGAFELNFDDKDFQGPHNQDNRPDIVLFVLAPEDALDNSLMIPLPPHQRIVHYSYIPVTNSGRTESFIIRLSDKQLSKFEIPSSAPQPPKAFDSESVTSMIEKSSEYTAAIRKKINERISERVEKTTQARTKSKEVFAKFQPSRFPQPGMPDETYLSPGSDLKEKQQEIVTHDLDVIRTSQTKRHFRLHLTDEEIAKYGLSVAENGSVSGSMRLDVLLPKIKESEKTTMMIRTGSLFDKCMEQIHSVDDLQQPSVSASPAGGIFSTTQSVTLVSTKPVTVYYTIDGGIPSTSSALYDSPISINKDTVLKFFAKDSSGNSSPVVTEVYAISTDGNSNGSTNLENDVFVRNLVTEVLHSNGLGEKPLDSRLDQTSLLESIKSFKATDGAADVTSYHDFHNLQIAFRPIWTEVFDKELKDYGELLYESFVKLQVFETTDFEKIETEQDLRNLLDYTERVVIMTMTEEVPLIVKDVLSDITPNEWSRMRDEDKTLLQTYATEYADLGSDDFGKIRAVLRKYGREQDFGKRGMNPVNDVKSLIKKTCEDILFRYRRIISQDKYEQGFAQPADSDENDFSRINRLFTQLSGRLSQKYKFDVFFPNSINYGTMITYRQEWKPISYQVGEMVSTIPLAPKEIRKFSTKKVTRKTRFKSEIEESQRIRKQEAANTSRIDAEIVRDAVNKTNFNHSAEGGMDIEMANFKGSHAFSVDSSKESKDIKKDFREAVLKSAEEYKQNHKLEVRTEEFEETEEVSSGEVSNPNDELTVTYLLYELERSYEITERIHRITPVILVANEVPSPDEIDEDWIVAHDWILRRVILDDSFLPTLDYVSKSLVGEELSIKVFRENMEKQKEIVEVLKQQVAAQSAAVRQALKELEKAVDEFIKHGGGGSGGIFGSIGTALFGSGGGDDAAKLQQEAAREAFERTQQEMRNLESRLSSELTSLEKATNDYTNALKEHLNRMAEIARLRIHIKDNILYYMQAIWNHEPRDHRYFRLYNILVPTFDYADTITAEPDVPVRSPDSRSIGVADAIGERIGFNFGRTIVGELTMPPMVPTYKNLFEVADLDNLLGYKGNYMIFPLKEHNPLTSYMSQDYIDSILGVKDPDEFAEFTTDELVDFIRCMHKNHSEALTADMKEELRTLLLERLKSPRKEKDLVIVPTGSLYIEALPGRHPILEDFKLAHRAMDVKKVAEEVTLARLENVRMIARILEKQLEDPRVDKKIVIEGGDKEVNLPHDDA